MHVVGLRGRFKRIEANPQARAEEKCELIARKASSGGNGGGVLRKK